MQHSSGRALLALGAILAAVLLVGVAFVALSPGPAPTPSPSPSPSPSPTPSASPSPSPTATASPTASPSATPQALVCPMNGEPIADPALAQRTAIMVQIENNPEARPPTGLNLADLVIEAPVEGDTTRFTAVYLCREPVGTAVGTVRSIRYYNVDLFQQLRGVTFNYGGATRVLRRLDNNEVPYVNGLSTGWPFFFRAGPYAGPHNVYLDVDAARAELQGGGLAALAEAAGPPRGPFDFAADVTLPEGRAVSSVGIRTADIWHFGWEWDAGSGLWLRTDAGRPNSDRATGDRLQARTVIVQVVRQEVLPGEVDPGGYPRRQQFLVDEGEGRMYVNGAGYDVLWRRAGRNEMTRWTYADTGEPVVLPPGRVWWEIIPEGSTITER